MYKIAVLVSGTGSNLQSIINNIEDGYLKDVSIEYVISDRQNAYALEIARRSGIPCRVFERKQYGEGLSDKILEVVKGKVDLIVLAGFLSIIKGYLVEEFKNRIINIHPSLIPSFCGRNMYGIRVHKAALEYGVKISGCTVHFVDENTDTGAIILQQSVPVFSEDSAEELQKRVLVQEHSALPRVIRLMSEERIKVDGRTVTINLAGGLV